MWGHRQGEFPWNFRADEQLERQLLVAHRQMGTDDTSDRAFVGDGQGGVAKLRGTLDELFRVRSAAQKREVGEAMKLGVAGEHAISGSMQRLVEGISPHGFPGGIASTSCKEPLQVPSPRFASLPKHP